MITRAVLHRDSVHADFTRTQQQLSDHAGTLPSRDDFANERASGGLATVFRLPHLAGSTPFEPGSIKKQYNLRDLW
jgi:hypothetical protein